jgi:hypothetical protein
VGGGSGPEPIPTTTKWAESSLFFPCSKLLYTPCHKWPILDSRLNSCKNLQYMQKEHVKKCVVFPSKILHPFLTLLNRSIQRCDSTCTLSEQSTALHITTHSVASIGILTFPCSKDDFQTLHRFTASLQSDTVETYC